jgi:hypothetical protein
LSEFEVALLVRMNFDATDLVSALARMGWRAQDKIISSVLACRVFFGIDAYASHRITFARWLRWWCC